MNFEDVLKNNGLTEDQIEAVKASMKENKIYTSNEENIDIRYSKLKEEKGAIDAELKKAQNLIDELNSNANASEEIKSKLTAYEAEIQTLKENALKDRIDFKIKSSLMERGVLSDNMDFVLFKINQENPDIKLNEKDELDGIDFDAIKTKYSAHFKAEEQNSKRFDPNGLPQGDPINKEPQSLSEALKAKFVSE